jgi:hypothetical protein
MIKCSLCQKYSREIFLYNYKPTSEVMALCNKCNEEFKKYSKSRKRNIRPICKTIKYKKDDVNLLNAFEDNTTPTYQKLGKMKKGVD